MNVFTDAHHPDLYYSLYLLFEKRLKANLYRPIGKEWHTKGFHNPPSVDPSTINGEIQLVDGVYHTPLKMEPDKGYYVQKAVTLDMFLKMDFDVVVTTTFEHEKAFHDILKEYKPKTVFIRQIGNIHEKPLGFCRNILLAQCTPMPSCINYIIYHPEHYEGYCYTPPTNHKMIKSFADDLPSYQVDLDTWNLCESTLQGFTFKMHGRGGRDGYVPRLLMPQVMKESAFIWHTKGHGGGGFVARQALACGRPCIIKKKYTIWHNELAKGLFMDLVNCIDLDLGVERGIKIIKTWAQPDHHAKICKATAEKFNMDANFAGEAEVIKEWIGNLLRK